MRLSPTIPLLGAAMLLAACAGTPPSQPQQAAATGSHVPGAAVTGHLYTVGSDELGRQSGVSTTDALAHSTASPYLNISGPSGP